MIPTHKTIEKVREVDEGYFKVTMKLQCFSGQAPYFSVTYELNENKNFTDRGFIIGGSNQEEIAKVFPECAKYMRWHLFSLGKGPIHYVSNSLYHASDRDCHGLLKGEKRQLKDRKTGLPSWQLVAVNKVTGEEISRYDLVHSIDSETQPECDYTLEYRPWCRIGEGKEPDLEAARRCALWPEAELSDFTEEKLLMRLPALVHEFNQDMLELGLIEVADVTS